MNRKERRAEQSRTKGGQNDAGLQALLVEAVAHHRAGRLPDAEQLYRQILAVDPRHADALNLMGVLALQVGRADVAVELITQAIAIRNDVADYFKNLAEAYKAQGLLDKTLAQYRRAASMKPDADTLNNIGTILRSQGKYSDAEKACRDALALNPNSVEILNNLGNIFFAEGKADEAISHFTRGIAIDPNNSTLHLNLGNVYKALQRLNDAIGAYHQAIALDPQNDLAHNNLATVLKDAGRLDEAIKSFHRSLELNPHSLMFFSNLLLAMVYTDFLSPVELLEESRRFGTQLADPLLRTRPFQNDKNPERKLRIGYVSGDFWNHAVHYFFEPLLTQRNRDDFEVFAYSNVFKEDQVTARLKSEFDHWRNITALNDDQAADLIEADAIDVLIDLSGHTASNRLLVFARKPAPVQLSWIGYPATTGMQAMDYRISDAYAEPPGMTEHLNVETIWRLPGIYACYQAHKNSPAVIDHPPFEDNGFITFGCFNNFSKVSDSTLAVWSAILEKLPTARLLLEIRGIEDPEYCAAIKDRLQASGLPLDRVILEPRKPSNQFVLYNKIDIALDPFPCVGGTTTMDTLWMGVPLITLAGDCFVGRMGVSILTYAGLPELIAQNTGDYIALATTLAHDHDRLRSLRHNLRQRVQNSPVMDQETFTRNMEAAYRGMWRAWCAGN